MSTTGSKHFHSYLLFGIIGLICGLFYWCNLIDEAAIEKQTREAHNIVSQPSPSAAAQAANVVGNYPIPDPETQLSSLSVEDYAMLQNLPSICVAEVPGIKDEDKPGCPATDVLAQVESGKFEETGHAGHQGDGSTEDVAFQNSSAQRLAPESHQPKIQLASAIEPASQPETALQAEPIQTWVPTTAAPVRQATFTNTGNAPFAERERSSPDRALLDHAELYDQALSQALSQINTRPVPMTSFNQQVQPVAYDASPASTATPEAHLAYNPHAKANANDQTSANYSEAKKRLDEEEIDPHLEAFSRSAYPSAVACAKCHEQIFDEWASSSHAYASISPMFHVFEDRINKLSQGTIGYFCMRCHAPVATTMGLRRDQAIWDGPRVFREGVTCVACHRVKTPYGKTNGERHMVPGDVEAPIYGGSDGKGVHLAADKYADWFKTKTDPQSKKPGQLIHRRSIQFEELSKSSYCMSCHQVAVEPGIKLEVVWDQYRASPAYREGVTCQECHMGSVPGVAAGYSFGPAAVVDGKGR